MMTPPAVAAIATPWHHYTLFGLCLRSARPMEFLTPAEPPADGADVEVCFAPVIIPDTPVIYAPINVNVHACGVVILSLDNGLKIRVEGGDRLTVELPAGLSEAALHALLFGPAMAILCHQRGLPPLHASVALIRGRGVAIAGDSGSGKSTAARALLRRGHRLLSDDQAIIDNKKLVVQPGYPSVKLWSKTAAATGDALDPLLRVYAGSEKYYLPMDDLFQDKAVPLTLILALKPDSTLRHPAVQRLSSVHAVALLHRLVLRWGVMMALDNGQAAFDWASDLAQRIPVLLLRRPDDIERLDELCERIEEVATSLPFRVTP